MQLRPLDFDQNARADASGFIERSSSSVLGESGRVPSTWKSSDPIGTVLIPHGDPIEDTIYSTIGPGRKES